MQRCIALARLGAGNVAPNPMVGAVLVHQDSIIGEGYHRQYGGPHAEVHCINSVKPEDRHLISQSVLYVSLEPCAHFGKTPPCADLIIQHHIPEVVIGARDPFHAVDGKGIEKLQQAGVQVVYGVLEEECRLLNQSFFTFHTEQRPYIILKWAQTMDGKIGTGTAERLKISNAFTDRLVHQWRAETAAIMVGTNTALLDDPALNVRYWKGRQPVRLVIDMQLRLPAHLRLFDGSQQTVVLNAQRQSETEGLVYCKIDPDASIIPQLMTVCYQRNIQSILIEGGSRLLQSFIEADCWDEARIITNTTLQAGEGLSAPTLPEAAMWKQETLLNDSISYFRRHGR